MKLTFIVGKFYRTRGEIKAECIEVKERRIVFQFYHEYLDQTLRFVTYLDGTTTDKEKHIVAEWSETPKIDLGKQLDEWIEYYQRRADKEIESSFYGMVDAFNMVKALITNTKKL